MKKILVGLMLVCGVAQAEYTNGNALLDRMSSSDAVDKMYALGYIVGVADTHENVNLCVQNTVTKGQLYDVVHQFLRSKPQLRDLPADVLVLLALGEHWRCPQKGKKKS